MTDPASRAAAHWTGFGHGRLRLYLLTLLAEGPRHGYDVMRLLEDRFLGLYAPSAGTVYPRLSRLEEEGRVVHDVDGGRKVYRITDLGRAELADRSDEVAALERDINGSVREMARAVRRDVQGQVRDLREELKAAAREVRRDARRERRALRPALETHWDTLADEVRGALAGARAAAVTDEQLAEARVVVRDAVARLREIFERDRPR